MSAQKTFDVIDKDTKRRQKRKKQEIALILPSIGTVLLLTPILLTFTTGDKTSQLSSTLLFIFGVWAILITAAFILSRVLVQEMREK